MKSIYQKMTKCLIIFSLFLTTVCVANQPLPVSADPSQTLSMKPQSPLIIPSPPRINAKAYVLMDANSGAILAQKNMNEKLPPASLTKLMTLYVVSEALAQGRINLDSKVHITKEAWSRGGSRMFLKLGSYATVKQLIEGIIVASGNDACVAIALYVGGNEQGFTQLMNQAAQQLGMKNTHFTDSTGLPHPDHYTTAYDLAILTRALINRFPQNYGWFKQKWIKYNKIRQPNRNRLLWRDPSVDGLKTGHTNAAGYCLIASAKRNDMRLISVVMGTPSDAARSDDSQKILNWGFRYYHSYKVFKSDAPITKARVWLGKQSTVQLGLMNDLYVTIPAGEYKSLKANIQMDSKLYAPINKGHKYGDVIVNLNGKTIATAPLVAMDSDPLGGWFSRTFDHIGLFFRKVF